MFDQVTQLRSKRMRWNFDFFRDEMFIPMRKGAVRSDFDSFAGFKKKPAVKLRLHCFNRCVFLPQ